MSACKNPASYKESGSATFQGKITTATAPTAMLDIHGKMQEIPLQSDGSFDINAEIPYAGIYKFYHGAQGMFIPLYLEGGSVTKLEADGANLIMSAKFDGDTKIENQYLISKMLNEPTLIQIDQTTLFTLGENEFLKKTEEIKEKLIDFKKEFQKQNGVFNPYFEEIVNQDITFQVTNLKMFYPMYYNYLMKTNDFKPSDSFYSFFQSIDINNEINVNSDHFKTYLPLYIEHLAKERNQNIENYESTGADKLGIVNEVITNPTIKEEVSFQIMKQAFETKLTDAFDMYEMYMAQVKDPLKKKDIETLYQQWLPLKPGNKAPAFSGTDKTGKKYSNDDLLGKVIYIDIWATWCGPCLAELPFLESLQEKFKNDKNIVFVSISIDQNKDAWSKMIVDKNMKGLQLYSAGAWNSEIIANYKVSGIPRFLIIDKEGNLVEGNATRPSNPATETALKNLL